MLRDQNGNRHKGVRRRYSKKTGRMMLPFIDVENVTGKAHFQGKLSLLLGRLNLRFLWEKYVYILNKNGHL